MCYDFDHKQRVSSTIDDRIMLVGSFEAVGDFKTVGDFQRDGYFGFIFIFDSH